MSFYVKIARGISVGPIFFWHFFLEENFQWIPRRLPLLGFFKNIKK